MLEGEALRRVLEDFDIDVYEEPNTHRLVYSVALAGEGESLDDAAKGLFESLMQLHETFEKLLYAIKTDADIMKN